MTRLVTLLIHAGIILPFAFGGADVHAGKPNPLKSEPLPQCGPMNTRFMELRDGLKQRLAWHGISDRQRGELKLYVGRDGSWTLYIHAMVDKGERVCAVARGIDGVAVFGRPI